MKRTVGRRILTLGLVARYTIFGFVLAVLAATAMAWFIETQVTDILVGQLVARAVDDVDLGIGARLSRVDLEPPYTPAKLADLAARLDPIATHIRGAGSGLLRLNILARDGTLVYSDRAGERGQPRAGPVQSLRANALAGIVGSRYASGSELEAGGVEGQDSGLAVYAPLIVDGQVTGTFELYRDLAPIGPVRTIVWGGVAAFFIARTLVLMGTVRRGASGIRRQQAAADEASALRRLDSLKNELLQTVSHELRTPLALINGYAELLSARRRTLPDAKVGQMLREIYRGSSTMTRIVDDLLEYSRIEQGRLRLRLVDCDVASVIKENVQPFTLQPGGERIVLDLASGALMATVDADRLSQIAVNLVTNALRYAPSGPVYVRLAEEPPGRVTLEVRDKGPGMSLEVLSHIWDMFYRAPEATDTGGGFGIGLALVKSMAEAHGGSVEAESTPGQGSAFRIRLPMRPAAAAQSLETGGPAPGPAAPSSPSASPVRRARDSGGRAAPPHQGRSPARG